MAVKEWVTLEIVTKSRGTEEAVKNIDEINKNLRLATQAGSKFDKVTSAMRAAREFIRVEKQLKELNVGIERGSKGIKKFTDLTKEGGQRLKGQMSTVVKRYTQNLQEQYKTQRKANKVLQNQSRLAKVAGKWLNNFRLEWLGVMFAAKRWTNQAKKATDPARELLNIEKIRQKFTAIKMLPAMTKELDKLWEEQEAWSNLSEEQRENWRTTQLFKEQLGKMLDNISSSVLAVWSLLRVAKWLGESFSTLTGTADETGGALGLLGGEGGVSAGALSMLLAVIILVIGTIGALKDAWENNWAGIRSTWEDSKPQLENIGSIFKSIGIIIWKAIKVIGGAIGGFLTGVFGDLLDSLGDGEGFIGKFADKLKEFANSNIWDTIEKVAFNFGHWIGEFFIRPVSDLIRVIRWVLDLLGKLGNTNFKRLFSSIGGQVMNIAGGGTGSNYNLPFLQQGGVVTQPTIGMVGERGPEAIIPLDKMNQGSTTINIKNVETTLQSENIPAVAKQLGDYIQKRQRSRTGI